MLDSLYRLFSQTKTEVTFSEQFQRNQEALQQLQVNFSTYPSMKDCQNEVPAHFQEAYKEMEEDATIDLVQLDKFSKRAVAGEFYDYDPAFYKRDPYEYLRLQTNIIFHMIHEINRATKYHPSPDYTALLPSQFDLTKIAIAEPPSEMAKECAMNKIGHRLVKDDAQPVLQKKIFAAFK